MVVVEVSFEFSGVIFLSLCKYEAVCKKVKVRLDLNSFLRNDCLKNMSMSHFLKILFLKFGILLYCTKVRNVYGHSYVLSMSVASFLEGN